MNGYAIREKERLKVARHSLQTGIALDIMGRAFEDISPSMRSSWFPLSKKQSERLGYQWTDSRALPYTNYPQGRAPYGAASFNTHFTLFLLEWLESCHVLMQREIAPALADLNKKLPTFKLAFAVDKYKEHQACPQQDNGLAIPVGVAIGLYAGLLKLPLDMVRDLTNGTAAACGMGSVQARSTLAISYLCWSLLESAYFGVEDMEQLSLFGMASDGMDDVLTLYEVHHDSHDFFAKIDRSKFENLPYTERILCESFFYLCRIATQFKDDVAFTTVPKENLNEVFGAWEGHTDLAFLFGVLCTLSEQTGEDGCYKLVIPEALVTESPFAKRVTDLFNSLD